MSRGRQELPIPPADRQRTYSEVDRGDVAFSPQRARKTFVLCFDGTGNKFSGTDADSNSTLDFHPLARRNHSRLTILVLKIYRMLDRSNDHQCKYAPDSKTLIVG